MPGAFKAFVDVYFRTIDVDGTQKANLVDHSFKFYCTRAEFLSDAFCEIHETKCYGLLEWFYFQKIQKYTTKNLPFA